MRKKKQVENNEEDGNQAERGLNQGYQRTRRSNRQDNVENKDDTD